jgi:DNA primase
VVIPIRDHQGKLKGAEARTVEETEHAQRYTAMWRCDKSDWLWGAWRVPPTWPLLVMEGALGAARAQTLGAIQPVSTLGASASEGQLRRMLQAPFVALAYDPDKAGRRGAMRVAEELIVTDHAIVGLPADIDDIGSAAFCNAVRAAAGRWGPYLIDPGE